MRTWRMEGLSVLKLTSNHIDVSEFNVNPEYNRAKFLSHESPENNYISNFLNLKFKTTEASLIQHSGDKRREDV